jgi:hypothetical protein
VLVTSIIRLDFLSRGSFLTVISKWSHFSLLQALLPEGFFTQVAVGQRVPPSSFFPEACGQEFRKVPILLHLSLLNCVQSLFPFWWGPTHLRPGTDFSNSEGRLDFLLRNLQYYCTSEAVPVSGFGVLHPYCVKQAFDISSRTSLL